MDEKKTVLIVEDEKSIVDILQYNLKKEYNILTANDGEAGLDMALKENPDILLLDLMLPKLDGFEVCRILREKGNKAPVIILTAREGEDDKVKGLELGADDYITKPFSIREVMARVKANIRRTAMEQGAGDVLTAAGGLRIHLDSYQVFKHDKPLELTQREYDLLAFLAGHPGKVYSRGDLMEQVWNYGYVGEDVRTVDVTVRRLREKIEDDPANPELILTRRGVGYYFAGQ
ncbi:MAG: response regulator transcription factor [Oscillospiraceae bacterium]|nr:response regulator transcription factor [Oscillospiraceae bacterium]